jgi:hypothetical protein
VEVEKMRKRAEVVEDQMVQREGDLRMAREDLEKLQKRTKGLYAPDVSNQLREELLNEREINSELREHIG